MELGEFVSTLIDVYPREYKGNRKNNLFGEISSMQFIIKSTRLLLQRLDATPEKDSRDGEETNLYFGFFGFSQC